MAATHHEKPELEEEPSAKRQKTGERKVAFLTGITGQDGSYLTEFLLNKGYEVHGLVRRSSSFNTGRIEHLYQDPHSKKRHLYLHYGDLTDTGNLTGLMAKIRPTEIYNLGAQSHVAVSFAMPEYTADVDGTGCLRLLEAIRAAGLDLKTTRYYQASTSELYGLIQAPVQDETTPFYPRSPYGVAKLYAYWTVINQRESYGIYACNGILFNHESPRRGATFVTRKITRAVAAIKAGTQDCLYLGNLDSRRDWGHARDYVEGMWLMLQQEKPEDFVLATNECHSVEEFCDHAFRHAGMELEFSGEGVDRIGTVKATGQVVVRVDPQYFRPAEVDLLLGSYDKAKRLLGWSPKITFETLVKEMVDADILALAEGRPFGDVPKGRSVE